MKEFQTLLNVFESQSSIAFEDKLACLFVEFLCARLHYRQEFQDLMMLRVDGMGSPEHVVALLDFVDGPQKLALEYHDLDIVRVSLEASVDLRERQLFITRTDIG